MSVFSDAITDYIDELTYKAEYYRRQAKQAPPYSTAETYYQGVAWAFENALATFKEVLDDAD